MQTTTNTPSLAVAMFRGSRAYALRTGRSWLRRALASHHAGHRRLAVYFAHRARRAVRADHGTRALGIWQEAGNVLVDFVR